MNKTKRPLGCNLADCPAPELCPLNLVRVGTAVRIKHLATPADVSNRLREMGLGEDQRVKLIIKGNNLICRVCNARLGISGKLAEKIMVEKLPASAPS
ncbi:MAG: FeoA family protein [Verrucomicrobiota bacterium]